MILPAVLQMKTSNSIVDAGADPIAESLVQRILKGDEDAFEEFVRQYHRWVASIAAKFFRQPEVVEDVCQEVFAKAYYGLRDMRQEVTLSSWLGRICTNTCYDLLRKNKRSREVKEADFGVELPQLISEFAASPDELPDRIREREETKELAERVLDSLDPGDRIVLTLMFLEELSVAEVAARTGWSATNVKVRAFRAKRRLRKILESANYRVGS